MSWFKFSSISVLLSTVLMSACEQADSLASVGNYTITSSTFSSYLKNKRIQSDDIAVQQRALDDLIAREALAQAIEQQNLLDLTQVEAELAELRRQVLISRYFEQHLNQKITDDMIRAFYANNSDKYESKQVLLSHILIRTNSRMTEAERQARLTLAREVYSKLNTGEDFARLALEYSEDKVSAKQGGSLGWLAEGAVSPEFSAKAFGLEQGQYSEPFMTSYGFHIVKLVEGPQTSRKPLEAVEGQIRYQLRKEAKQAEMQRLQDSVTIKLHQSLAQQ